MNMRLPRILKGFDLYMNGNNYAGVCDKFTLPKNAPKLEELNAGGLSRPLKVNVGFESDWDLTFSAKGLDLDLLILGDCTIDGNEVMILGSVSEGDSCTEHEFKAYFWGQIAESDAGDLENNALSSNDITFAAARVQYFLDGKEIYFEDPMNMIRRVNGKDTLEQRRKNLGRQ